LIGLIRSDNGCIYFICQMLECNIASSPGLAPDFIFTLNLRIRMLAAEFILVLS